MYLFCISDSLNTSINTSFLLQNNLWGYTTHTPKFKGWLGVKKGFKDFWCTKKVIQRLGLENQMLRYLSDLLRNLVKNKGLAFVPLCKKGYYSMALYNRDFTLEEH